MRINFTPTIALAALAISIGALAASTISDTPPSMPQCADVWDDLGVTVWECVGPGITVDPTPSGAAVPFVTFPDGCEAPLQFAYLCTKDYD